MTDPYMPQDALRRVCAVCARGLNRLFDTHTGNWEYVHPFDMEIAETDDHPPVPVTADEIQADTRCDFCFWRDPQWVIPVRDFQTNADLVKLGMPLGTESIGSWAACDTCADYVNRGLWSNLIRRASAAFVQVHMEITEQDPRADEKAMEFTLAHLRSTYRQLRKNILGPPRRLNG